MEYRDDSVPEDELRAARWYLRDAYAHRLPSDQAWPRILARVQAERIPAPLQKRRANHVTTRLVQAVTISIVVMILGIQLEQASPARPAPRGPRTSHGLSTSAFPRDALSGYVLVQEAKAENLRRARSIPEL